MSLKRKYPELFAEAEAEFPEDSVELDDEKPSAYVPQALDDALTELTSPLDRLRSASRSFKSGVVSVDDPAGLIEDIRELEPYRSNLAGE